MENESNVVAGASTPVDQEYRLAPSFIGVEKLEKLRTLGEEGRWGTWIGVIWEFEDAWSHLRYSKADMLRANSLYVSKIVAPERDWPASIMPLSLARK
ncbi:hypothetical protein M747DRAFT_345288 [Aspergillus niger ATCC 13496]|uniref:Uncharacterized protein n=1 Tax=Aspergillus niger ATCC 13496 TaxID=1353008 RepID=A0A370BLD8_ASPNG|nr:hypothetical protein M747DRAFT_345288 [Aspergillus niger ATCC 13496]